MTYLSPPRLSLSVFCSRYVNAVGGVVREDDYPYTSFWEKVKTCEKGNNDYVVRPPSPHPSTPYHTADVVTSLSLPLPFSLSLSLSLSLFLSLSHSLSLSLCTSFYRR